MNACIVSSINNLYANEFTYRLTIPVKRAVRIPNSSHKT